MTDPTPRPSETEADEDVVWLRDASVYGMPDSPSLFGGSARHDSWKKTDERLEAIASRLSSLSALVRTLGEAVGVAECALSDIGDATRLPTDDLDWAERRAANVLPSVRAALAEYRKWMEGR